MEALEEIQTTCPYCRGVVASDEVDIDEIDILGLLQECSSCGRVFSVKAQEFFDKVELKKWVEKMDRKIEKSY